MFFKALTVCVLVAFHYSSGQETIGLRIALVDLEPFVIKDSNGVESGFLVDVIKELFHRVNRTAGVPSIAYRTYWLDADFEEPESIKWDKVRSAFLKNEAEMALMPLADTSGWNGFVQLSQPFLLAPFLPVVAKKMLGTDPVLTKVRQNQVKGLYVYGSAMGSMIELDSRSPAKDLRDMFGQGNDSQVPHHHGGIERIQSDPDRLALFGEELRLKRYVLQAKACDLAIDYKSIVGIGAYSLPISKAVINQPFISAINSHLLDMRQDGAIAILKNKWWPAPSDAACKPADDIFGSLEYVY